MSNTEKSTPVIPEKKRDGFQRAKQATIKFLRNQENKPYIASSKGSWTTHELADEIAMGSDVGNDMIEGMLILTADLILRGKEKLPESNPVIEQKEEVSERSKIIDELVIALGEQEILSQKILTVLGREKYKPESKQLNPKTEDELLEIKTERNAKIVSSFMNHCKEEGLEIPDSMFESYFNA